MASPAIYSKEELLICVPTSASSRRVILCGRCCRPAAGARHHLALALGKSRAELRSGCALPDLPGLLLDDDHGAAVASASPPFWCLRDEGRPGRACDEAYCSRGCRAAASTAHALACCRGLSSGAPLLEFERLTAAAGAEHLRVAARLLSAEAAAALEAGPSLAAVSALAQQSAARLEALCADDEAGLATSVAAPTDSEGPHGVSGSDADAETGADAAADPDEKGAAAWAEEAAEADAAEAGGLLHVGMMGRLAPSFRASPLGAHLLAPRLFVKLAALLRRRLLPLHAPSPLPAYCAALAQGQARGPPGTAAASAEDLQRRGLELLLPAAARAASPQIGDDLEGQLNALLCAEARDAAFEAATGVPSAVYAPAVAAAAAAVAAAGAWATVVADPAVARRAYLLAQCAPRLFPPADLLALAPRLFRRPAGGGSGGAAVPHSCVPTAQLQLTPDDLASVGAKHTSPDGGSPGGSPGGSSGGALPLLWASLVAVRVDAAAAIQAAAAAAGASFAAAASAAAATGSTSVAVECAPPLLPPFDPAATVSWADFEPHATARERRQALRRKLGRGAGVGCKCDRCLDEETAAHGSGSNGNSCSSSSSNNEAAVARRRRLVVLARDAIEGGRFADAAALLRTRLRGLSGGTTTTSGGGSDNSTLTSLSASFALANNEAVEEEGAPWVLLGLCLLNLGSWSAARRVWAQGMVLHPTHPLLMLQRQKDVAYNQSTSTTAANADGATADTSKAANGAEHGVAVGGAAVACGTWLLGDGPSAPRCVVTLQPLLSPASCAFAIRAAEAFAADAFAAAAATPAAAAADATSDASGVVSLDVTPRSNPVASSSSEGGGGQGWTTSRHYAVPTTDLPVHGVPPLVPWFKDLMVTSVAPLLEKHWSTRNQGDSNDDDNDGDGGDSSGGSRGHPSSQARQPPNYMRDGPGSGPLFAAAQVRVHDAFVVRYSGDVAGQACHLPLHCDESTLSFTLSLNAAHGDGDAGDLAANDGTDVSASLHGGLPRYSGGGTYFAALRRALRPKIGCCALFDGRALHGGAPTTAGTRYILAAFLYLDTGVPRHLRLRQAQHPKSQARAALRAAPAEEEAERADEKGQEEKEQEEEREPWEEEAVHRDAPCAKRPRLFVAASGDAKEAEFSFGFSFGEGD